MTIQHARRIVKSLFVLFIIVVCIYLLPLVAINAFYYPDNKVYGPTPAEAESVIFTAKDGSRLHGWFIPSSTGPAENAIATVVHVHGNAGNMSAHWPLVSWLPKRNVNLFLHGTEDHVIPWQHSEALFAIAGEPKQKIIIPEGEHIDAFSGRHGEIYRDAAMDFICQAVK